MPIARIAAALALLALLPTCQAGFQDAHPEEAYQSLTLAVDDPRMHVTLARHFELDRDEAVYVWLDSATLAEAEQHGLSLDVRLGLASANGSLEQEILFQQGINSTQPIGPKPVPGNATAVMHLVVGLPPAGQRVPSNVTLRALIALNEDLPGAGSGGTYDPTIASNLLLQFVAASTPAPEPSPSPSYEPPPPEPSPTPSSTPAPSSTAAAPSPSPTQCGAACANGTEAGENGLSPIVPGAIASSSNSTSPLGPRGTGPAGDGGYGALGIGLWILVLLVAVVLGALLMRRRRQPQARRGKLPSSVAPRPASAPEPEAYEEEPPEEPDSGIRDRETAPVGPGGRADLKLR